MSERQFWAMEEDEARELKKLVYEQTDRLRTEQGTHHAWGITTMRGLGGYALALRANSQEDANLILDQLPEGIPVQVRVLGIPVHSQTAETQVA